MRRSNTPSVDGLVSMIPAVLRTDCTAFRASIHPHHPRASVGISLHLVQPHMVCGRRIGAMGRIRYQDFRTVRVSPFEHHGRPCIIATPANSPCAPAIGVSDTPAMPVTVFQHFLQLVHAGREIPAHGLAGAKRMATGQIPATSPAHCRRADCISWCRSPAGRNEYQSKNSIVTIA